MTERRAMAAERDSTDRYVAAFMEDRVGATFDARITGVTRFGLFVRLAESGAEGPAARSAVLGAEYFRHDETRPGPDRASAAGISYGMGDTRQGEAGGGRAGDREACASTWRNSSAGSHTRHKTPAASRANRPKRHRFKPKSVEIPGALPPKSLTGRGWLRHIPAPLDCSFWSVAMAKPTTAKIRLNSEGGTGFFYVTKKNTRTMTEKFSIKKYDPVLRKHVEFKEGKIK